MKLLILAIEKKRKKGERERRKEKRERKKKNMAGLQSIKQQFCFVSR